MDDPPPKKCEVCGSASVERVFYPVAVHYKGSGFYSTDYGRSRKRGGKESSDGGGEKSSESKSDSKSESKSSESKSEKRGSD